MSRPAEKIAFHSDRGHALSGRLHRPLGATRGVALFAHCFTCSKDLNAARRIAQALAGNGFATLRFDFTGLGQSEGDFADSTFSTDLEDLRAAADWLADTVGAPTLLVGHSLGGAAVLAVAERLDSVRAVATIGAPSDPGHVEHLFAEHADTIEETGSATVDLAGREFEIRQAFLDDLDRHPLVERLPDLDRATLFLHSPQDTTVGVEHARTLFEAAWHPKSFVSLDGADHLLSDAADAAYAGDVIASWARRYAADEVEPPATQHDDDVEVWLGDDGFATDVAVRGLHRLRADEPADMGGTDTGPTPYELVSAGLGACTVMTLRMYADRKGWPLEAVEAHVRHGRIHAEDCGSCGEDGGGTGKIDRFERDLHLVGDLSDEQRDRLLEIADRCPVHRTLHGPVDIVTNLTHGATMNAKEDR